MLSVQAIPVVVSRYDARQWLDYFPESLTSQERYSVSPNMVVRLVTAILELLSQFYFQPLNQNV